MYFMDNSFPAFFIIHYYIVSVMKTQDNGIKTVFSRSVLRYNTDIMFSFIKEQTSYGNNFD